jgi:beta-lactamase superfamily II metal-dependent hydrolase
VCLVSVCALFTGDIGDQGERALLDRHRERPEQLRSQVLKVSHHGAAEPNRPELLELIAPEVALIGAGANNRFGHPTQKALDRLKAAGAAIYCTHVDGTIVVEISQTGYSMTTRPDIAIPARGRTSVPLADPSACGR